MSDQEPAVGIDLGTTYSCVAIYRNNKVDIIPNDIGHYTTPSVVSFTKNERLIGESAKGQITRNYKNTIYDAKRLIGRGFKDPIVQKDIKLWPFKVEKDPNSDRPVIVVEYKNEIKKFLAEEISAMILGKLKKCASDFLGKEINDAVVTVPAYFNDSQRQATKDAGTIAGLNVLRIINEPTAAAVAYGLDNRNKTDGDKNVLIFDLGGGTFDVSILNIDNSLFEVRATRGDTHLGGEDFDNYLVNYCIEQFKNNTGIDISNDQKALRRLKVVCEKCKRDLSSAQQTNLDIDALAEGEDFQITISRPEFEDLCMESFKKCIPPIDDALKDANLNKNDISDIVLVGGSTRIPKIQEMVQTYFKGKELNKTINPDEAVAYGAAIQAAIINDVEDDGLERLVLLDVTPLSLGVEIVGGKMSTIIKRNTTIPCRNSGTYYTVRDNQESVCIKIFQGERELTKDNHFLGKFTIDGIRKAPAGEVSFEETFELDINNLLKVTAREIGRDNKKELTIKCDNDRLTESEIKRLVEEAEKLKNDDLERVRRVDAKLELEKFLIDIGKKDFNTEKKNKVKEKINEIKKWCRDYDNEPVSVYQNKKKEFERFVNNL